MSDSLFDTWLENPLLVACSYFLLVLSYWILVKKSISLRQQKHANHHIQEFYMLNPVLREIESTSPSLLPPVRVIRFWILRMIVIILLAYSRLLSELHEILLLRDLATIALGLYFCRQVWSILTLLNHILKFKDLIDNPADVSGTVKFSNAFVYQASKATSIIPALLWSFLFLLVGHIFFLGGIIDMFVLDYSISQWEKKDES